MVFGISEATEQIADGNFENK